jgi:hypothetical protein
MRVYRFLHKGDPSVVVAETLDEAVKAWRLFTIDIDANEEPETTSILHERVLASRETALAKQYDECAKELTMLKAKSRQQHSSDEHQIKRLEAAVAERTKQCNDLQDTIVRLKGGILGLEAITRQPKKSAADRMRKIVKALIEIDVESA